MIKENKKCFKCKIYKKRKYFYKHSEMSDGLLGKCKFCTRKDALANRAKNIDSVRKYDRYRGLTKERRAFLTKNAQRWRKENHLKYKAHALVNYHKKVGNLKIQPCEVCGVKKVHGHHDDYRKPLDVHWLCAIHHAARHKELRVKK